MVIGRDAKDVSESDALDYVAAYTVGNDISSRKLQREAAYAGRIPQWGFSKGFDTFAPLGPVLVNSKLVPDPSKLQLKTEVNGQLRQEEGVSDLLFSVPYLISYLSTGTTLQKGSVIMTGTPGGVYFRTILNFNFEQANNGLRRCRGWNEPSTIPSSRR